MHQVARAESAVGASCGSPAPAALPRGSARPTTTCESIKTIYNVKILFGILYSRNLAVIYSIKAAHRIYIDTDI